MVRPEIVELFNVNPDIDLISDIADLPCHLTERLLRTAFRDSDSNVRAEAMKALQRLLLDLGEGNAVILSLNILKLKSFPRRG